MWSSTSFNNNLENVGVIVRGQLFVKIKSTINLYVRRDFYSLRIVIHSTLVMVMSAGLPFRV